MAGFGGYNVPSLETRRYLSTSLPILNESCQLQIANPFPSNEDVFARRIWCEKTTSSWQKVHPKQKNLPENKALLSGGAR